MSETLSVETRNDQSSHPSDKLEVGLSKRPDVEVSSPSIERLQTLLEELMESRPNDPLLSQIEELLSRYRKAETDLLWEDDEHLRQSRRSQLDRRHDSILEDHRLAMVDNQRVHAAGALESNDGTINDSKLPTPETEEVEGGDPKTEIATKSSEAQARLREQMHKSLQQRRVELAKPEDLSPAMLERAKRMSKILPIILLPTPVNSGAQSTETIPASFGVQDTSEVAVSVENDKISGSDLAGPKDVSLSPEISDEPSQSDFKPVPTSWEFAPSDTEVAPPSSTFPVSPEAVEGIDSPLSEASVDSRWGTEESINDLSVEQPKTSPKVEIQTEVSTESKILITPQAVEAYKSTYNGGVDAWNEAFKTYVKSYVSSSDGGWMSKWFNIDTTQAKDILDYIKDTNMTIGQFNSYVDGDAEILKNYLRDNDLSRVDFQNIREMLSEISQNKNILVTNEMTVFYVLEAGFVERHATLSDKKS